MGTYGKRHLFLKSNPDLFDWQYKRAPQHENPAATWIAKRYGLSLQHALIIARLAALGPEITR
jgi:hypothetical protein